MYRHEGALCETENTTNGVKSNINDPSVPNFVRRTSMRDMLNLGDVDDLIEAQEDVNEAKLSTSNYRCQGRGIPIPLSPSKDEGPIVVMSSSRSIFDIDDDENVDDSEIPVKRNKTEEKQCDVATNESQLFDNDFDDLDFSSLDAEYSKDKTSQNHSNVPLTIDENVLKAQQKERSEKNRQKALALKNAKLVVPKSQPKECFLTGESLESHTSSLSQEKKTIDTGAGFFIEEDDEIERKVTEDPAPLLPNPKDGGPRCEECSEELQSDSYLFKTFDLEVCDKCKDTSKDGKHELITKTDAKNIFLLKDYDFDRREPPLKFITRKNPHNQRWGDMKLFLRIQVEKRALEVWKTEEALEKEIEKKEDRRELVKAKKFGKRIKELRMQMRGSLFAKDYKTATGVGHEHDYEPEIYNEEKDEYSRKCTICGYINTYEKM